MTQLVVAQPGEPERVACVQQLLAAPALARHPQHWALASGLWLYIDELDRSHRIAQERDADATCNYWHAIMHRREGDFCNSKYWFRRVGKHPAMKTLGPAYDPFDFVDRVAGAYRQGPTPAELVDLQRQEWRALFAWCAGR